MTFLKSTVIKLLLPITLLVASVGFIFYRFPNLPQQLSKDEVEFIKLALSLKTSQYAPYTPLATGHATFYFYAVLASLETFGVNPFGLRFPSALFGVLNVLILFEIFKKAFAWSKFSKKINLWICFLLSMVFLTSHWYLNFARFSFEATFLLFFELGSLWSIIKFQESKSKFYLILSGIFSGLAFNSYTPGRIFFIVPIFYLILSFQNKFNVQLSTKLLKNLLAFIIPFIICITPLTLYFQNHDDNRIYELFFIQNEQLSIPKKLNFLGQNVTSLTEMFVLKGDINGRHNYPGKPMLNPILSGLFVLGFILALKNWKNKFNLLFIIFFIVGILPPLMTYPWENPNALRSINVVPSVVYFVGISTFFLLRIPIPKKILIYSVSILIYLSIVYELRTYFVFQALVFPESFEIPFYLLQPILEGKYKFILP